MRDIDAVLESRAVVETSTLMKVSTLDEVLERALATVSDGDTACEAETGPYFTMVGLDDGLDVTWVRVNTTCRGCGEDILNSYTSEVDEEGRTWITATTHEEDDDGEGCSTWRAEFLLEGEDFTSLLSLRHCDE